MPCISSNQGFAGLSGRAVKHTALANVFKMRQKLVPEIDVVGVGGIETGQDVFEFLLCGATAVQVGTCHWKEGPKCFDRICAELKTLLGKKGYASCKDVQGKLNPWSKEGASKSRAASRKAKEVPSSDSTKKLVSLDLIHAALIVIIAVLLADKFVFIN
mmetsp:Transcript_6927/g.10106  ORF Transcript_6927/g.10106 Transcript_6927/m.10106 type:complete len:159 (-) Transcript_6927:2906-3382(-)